MLEKSVNFLRNDIFKGHVTQITRKISSHLHTVVPAMQIDWIGSNVIFDALSEANKILFISFILGIIREVWAAHISKSQQLKLCVYLDITVFDIFIYLCDLS